MNNWGLGGGFISPSVPNGGLLELEPSMHGHPQAQSAHPSASNQHPLSLLEKDCRHTGLQQGQLMRLNKGKAPAAILDNSNTSDEDGPNFEDGNGENFHGAKGKKNSSSPWQRMKWSDDVVRLLIAVVACVGVDGAPEVGEGFKRKSGMITQKKGKWQTVSKIMIKRGCLVSPQQCEDKFSDLNKRYKRLNDILGRGATCRIVENPALLDSMQQLSTKAKDDAQKILSSKHLFYKEMCAYHNGQSIPNCQDLDLQGHSFHSEKENVGSDDEAESNGEDSDESDDEDEDDADRYTERLESYNVGGGSSGRGRFESQMAGMFRDPSKSPAEKKEWIKRQLLQLQERKIQFEAQSVELEKQRFKWQRYSSKKQRELERLTLENERMHLENERWELQLKQKELEIGPRKLLVDVVSVTWNDISMLSKSSTAARSPLLRKFLVKLTQRIALTCLPPRTPSWRYVIKTTTLGDDSVTAARKLDSMRADYAEPDITSECSDDEDVDVPEVIEEIIEMLLSGLRDTDTVVRWSAAKGIGRITSRLTSALSEEVLSSVLELFSPGEGDGSWHGGCLALAELARRGLLLPSSLPKVVPVVVKALHYDIRRGPHSVGSHVRDAAAYVCWAFGRAYCHQDMRSVLDKLAPHLLTVACYDREVNCRRASAAAFQENVGRQGNYPHGIDIVNSADYFSLSSRVNSYLHVAISIAQYEGYLHPFAEELISSKICHWDKSLRELAGEALAALVKYDPEYFANVVLEKLIPSTLSTDLCLRHGATLAAAELLLALHQCGHTLSSDKQKQISGIVPAIEKARLYRGKGGEIMRSAVSRFIECISLSHLLVPEKIRRSLLDTINENLRHPSSQIQIAACKAFQHFALEYLVDPGKQVPIDITSKHLGLLADPNVAVRRGSAMALGVLPYELISSRWKDVIKQLCTACAIEDNPDDRDAEARVNAVKGLVSVCETIIRTRECSGTLPNEEYVSLYLLIKNEVMKSLFSALEDYSVDNRGDVGSWVREAAMDALERCSYILCKRDVTSPGEQREKLFDAGLATTLVGGILKQAAEKMDKLREAAANILQRILYNKEIFVPFISHREKLEEIIPNEQDLKWAVPTFSFPRFVELLQVSSYSRSVLSGLVISVGGLQDSLRKAATSALLEYLHSGEGKNSEERKHREHMVSTDLLWVLQEYRKCDRVITPTLKTIEILFSKRIFLELEDVTSTFCDGLLDSLAVELRASKDFSKLYAGIAILGFVASVLEPVNRRAFTHLLTLLGHRYPKIRRASAEQAYLVILQNGGLVSEDKIEKALEIVSETCWEGDIEAAKQQRSELFDIAGIEIGSLLKANTSSSGTSDVRGRKKPPGAATDENASYSSLVGSTGF